MKLGTLGKRERVLLAILLLLVPIGAWRYVEPAIMSFARGGAGGVGQVSGVTQRKKAREEIESLRLAALEAQGGEYQPDRNIFRYGEKRRPPPPPVPPPPVTAALPVRRGRRRRRRRRSRRLSTSSCWASSVPRIAASRS